MKHIKLIDSIVMTTATAAVLLQETALSESDVILSYSGQVTLLSYK